MTYKQAIKTLAAVAGLALGAANVSATEITILDSTGPLGQPVSGPAWGWNGGPRGTAFEDNETEAVNSPSGVIGAIKRQAWDLEGLSVKNNHLYMVGGYDFNIGIPGDTGSPGDLFIKIGSPGTYLPLSNPSGGNYLNGSPGPAPNYSYAIRLSAGGLGSGGAVSVTVLDLNGRTVLNSDDNDNLGSNPWKVDSGNTVANGKLDATFSTTAHYYQGLNDAGVVAKTGEPGYATLHGDTDFGNTGGYYTGPFAVFAPLTNLHNVLDIDLSWLLAPLAADTSVYFSYTMQCGNDSVKGHLVVPDGGTSLILMGGALSTLCLFGRRLRK